VVEIGGIPMNNDTRQAQPKPEPSKGPLKNEPTPEQARKEKERMEQQATQPEVPKRSGAV